MQAMGGDLDTGIAKALLENEVKEINLFVGNCNIEETTTNKMGYVVLIHLDALLYTTTEISSPSR